MTPDSLPPEKMGPANQRDVQRLMGRCLIRIQQYEQLLKTVLAHHEIAGAVETLKAQPEIRAEKLSGQTLGNLVKQMFESLVVPEGYEPDLLPEDRTPTDRVSFAYSFRLTLPAESWVQTKAAVDDLVSTRNELVHHFLSRFNLWEEAGCVEAINHLEDLYRRVDTHYQDLRVWVVGMEKARQEVAAFVRTDVWQDMVFNGINPDGSFEWRHTGIVRALQWETRSIAGEGWTPFDVVKARMLERHADQTPQKYRCTTWPQVLSESGAFDLTYRRDSDTAPKRAWVRLRPERAAGSSAKERRPPGRDAVVPPTPQASEPDRENGATHTPAGG